MASEFDTPKNIQDSDINQAAETSPNRRRAIRGGLVGTVAALGLLSASPAEAGARHETREATPPNASALYYERLAQLPPDLKFKDPRDVFTDAVDTCNDRAGKSAFEEATANVNDQKLRRGIASVTMTVKRQPDTAAVQMNYATDQQPEHYYFNIACGALFNGEKEYLGLRTKSGSILGNKRLPGKYALRRLSTINNSADAYRVIDPNSSKSGHNSAAEPQVDTLTASTTRKMTFKDLKKGNIIPVIKRRYGSLRDPNYHNPTGQTETQKERDFKSLPFQSTFPLTISKPKKFENDGDSTLLSSLYN